MVAMTTYALYINIEATYIEGELLAPHNPDSSDAIVTILAKNEDAGKGILAKFVQTLHHP